MSLFSLALPSAFSSLLHLASPTSWPQPPSLQQLLKPAANFLQNFALPVKARTLTLLMAATSLPAAASAASAETTGAKSLFLPFCARSQSPSRQKVSPPHIITWPEVRVSQEYVAYSCRQPLPSSAVKAQVREASVQAGLFM